MLNIAERSQTRRTNLELGRFTSGRFAMQPGAQGELFGAQ